MARTGSCHFYSVDLKWLWFLLWLCMVIVMVLVMVMVIGMAMIMVGDWQEPILAICELL